MKNTRTNRLIQKALIALLAVACASVCFARNTAGSINVVNSSGRAIRNVYFAHVDQNDWGANQLGDNASIAAGASQTISVSWDQPQLAVIAEDQDGCFLSTVAASGDNTTWTITNETARNCGG